MQVEDINKIAVIGSGTMGQGIAEVAALAGYEVNLRDIKRELVEKGLNSINDSLSKMSEEGIISKQEAKQTGKRIHPLVSLKEATHDAHFVIEVIPEKLELKKKLFKDLDKLTSPETILATNTSSLSITELASVTRRPNQVIGMHFFNPAVKMKLVEVIRGSKTSDETLESTTKLAKELGKTPVVCKKDIRGFIVNSILVPYLNEACRTVSQKKATFKEIDSALRYKENLPMGPFELMDLIGLDVVADIGEAIDEEIPSLLKEKLETKQLGRKSDRGFYNYQQGGVDYVKEQGEEVDTLPFISIMANRAAILLEKSAASREDIETAMKLGTGMTKGPLAWAKEVSIKQVVNKLKELQEKYDKDRYKPANWLSKQAKSGG